MQPNPFRMAMIQMFVEGGQRDENLARAVDRIADAASNGAQVALLPECLDVGWTHSSSRELATPIPEGKPFRALADAAREHGVYVCAGLTERDGEMVHNTAVLIDSHGELLIKHRKLNELDIGHAFYAQGDRLNVAHTDLGCIGLMTCADGFAKGQVLTRSLGYMGADVVLSPCAWAVPADHNNVKEPYGELWRESYMPVAREFAMIIVGVSNVGPITAGPWAGRKCIGCSLAIDADGEEIVQLPYGEDADCTLLIDVQSLERPARGNDWEARG